METTGMARPEQCQRLGDGEEERGPPLDRTVAVYHHLSEQKAEGKPQRVKVQASSKDSTSVGIDNPAYVPDRPVSGKKYGRQNSVPAGGTGDGMNDDHGIASSSSQVSRDRKGRDEEQYSRYLAKDRREALNVEGKKKVLPPIDKQAHAQRKCLEFKDDTRVDLRKQARQATNIRHRRNSFSGVSGNFTSMYTPKAERRRTRDLERGSRSRSSDRGEYRKQRREKEPRIKDASSTDDELSKPDVIPQSPRSVRQNSYPNGSSTEFEIEEKQIQPLTENTHDKPHRTKNDKSRQAPKSKSHGIPDGFDPRKRHSIATIEVQSEMVEPSFLRRSGSYREGGSRSRNDEESDIEKTRIKVRRGHQGSSLFMDSGSTSETRTESRSSLDRDSQDDLDQGQSARHRDRPRSGTRSHPPRPDSGKQSSLESRSRKSRTLDDQDIRKNNRDGSERAHRHQGEHNESRKSRSRSRDGRSGMRQRSRSRDEGGNLKRDRSSSRDRSKLRNRSPSPSGWIQNKDTLFPERNSIENDTLGMSDSGYTITRDPDDTLCFDV